MTSRIGVAALLLVSVLAGCGHGHDRGDGAGSAAQLLKDQDDAADAIVSESRAYLEAREKTGKPAPKGAIGAHDFALEALLDVAQASRIAAAAERGADDANADPGRAARVKSGADLLRRAAQVTANQARETLRTGDDTTLKIDAIYLRALLRAIKVDVLALERQVNE